MQGGQGSIGSIKCQEYRRLKMDHRYAQRASRVTSNTATIAATSLRTPIEINQPFARPMRTAPLPLGPDYLVGDELHPYREIIPCRWRT